MKKKEKQNIKKKQTQLESDIDTQNITSNVRFILQGGTTGFFSVHLLAPTFFYHFIELKLSLENNKRRFVDQFSSIVFYCSFHCLVTNKDVC